MLLVALMRNSLAGVDGSNQAASQPSNEKVPAPTSEALTPAEVDPVPSEANVSRDPEHGDHDQASGSIPCIEVLEVSPHRDKGLSGERWRIDRELFEFSSRQAERCFDEIALNPDRRLASLCDAAAQVMDFWASRKIKLVVDSSDANCFQGLLGLWRWEIIAPLKKANLDEFEERSIEMKLQSRIQFWNRQALKAALDRDELRTSSDPKLARDRFLPEAGDPVGEARLTNLAIPEDRDSETRSTGEANGKRLDEAAAVRECQSTSVKLDRSRIEAFMTEEGYTNETLAAALKCSSRAISSLRNDGMHHGRDVVTRLANLMGCEPDELLVG